MRASLANGRQWLAARRGSLSAFGAEEIAMAQSRLRDAPRTLLLARAQAWPARVRVLLGQGLPSLLPLAATLAWMSVPTWPGAAALACGALAHVLGRRALQRVCAGTAATLEPAISLLIALLLPLHLLHAALVPRIRWREHRYRVYANDHFEALP